MEKDPDMEVGVVSSDSNDVREEEALEDSEEER